MDRPSPGPGLTAMALTPRWLLVVPALPRMTAGVRSKTLNRLRRLGAITVKPSVFVLPDSPAAREDVAWLKADVERGGGEMTAFAADSVDAWTDDRLVEEFRRTTQAAYARLALRFERALASGRRPARRPGPAPACWIGSWHVPPISNASTFSPAAAATASRRSWPVRGNSARPTRAAPERARRARTTAAAAG